MTDRDPIAQALEDLRKKEEAEAEQKRLEEGPFEHFSIVEPAVEVHVRDYSLEQLLVLARLRADSLVDYRRWKEEVEKYPTRERDVLMVVRQRERMSANDTARMLREEGLDIVDARELCAYREKVPVSQRYERLYALGASLLEDSGSRRPAINARYAYLQNGPNGEVFCQSQAEPIGQYSIEAGALLLVRVSEAAQAAIAKHKQAGTLQPKTP